MRKLTKAESARLNGTKGGRPRVSSAILAARHSSLAKKRAIEERAGEADDPIANVWCIAMRAELSKLRNGCDDVEWALANHDERQLNESAEQITQAAERLDGLIIAE
jgi:hypothetical protein